MDNTAGGAADDEHIQSLHESFDLHDDDGDGRLDRHEFADAYRCLGYNPTDKEIDAAFVSRSEGGLGGVISREEFVT